MAKDVVRLGGKAEKRQRLGVGISRLSAAVLIVGHPGAERGGPHLQKRGEGRPMDSERHSNNQQKRR